MANLSLEISEVSMVPRCAVCGALYNADDDWFFQIQKTQDTLATSLKVTLVEAITPIKSGNTYVCGDDITYVREVLKDG